MGTLRKLRKSKATTLKSFHTKWHDNCEGSVEHYSLPFRINGHPYTTILAKVGTGDYQASVVATHKEGPCVLVAANLFWLFDVEPPQESRQAQMVAWDLSRQWLSLAWGETGIYGLTKEVVNDSLSGSATVSGTESGNASNRSG